NLFDEAQSVKRSMARFTIDLSFSSLRSMKIFLCIFVSVYSLAVMANDIHAVGRFENFSFDLKAKDVNELQHECMRFALAQRIAHIDDIFVSFNGHKRMHLHNRDGVWHYPKHYCGELVKVAQ